MGTVGNAEISELWPLFTCAHSMWSGVVLRGQECSGLREQESKCGWVSRCDPEAIRSM